MSARETLLAHTRSILWRAWSTSSEELASAAVDTLMNLGMLVPEGGAIELERLRAQAAEQTTELETEQAALLAEMIGDVQPARVSVLLSLGESVRDTRGHDHTSQREDWYCTNLVAYMGERMAPVLRRLLNSEARAAQLAARVAELEAERTRVAALLPTESCIEEGLPNELAAAEAEYGAFEQVAYTLGVQIPRPLEDPHNSPLHHTYTTGRDLPRSSGACGACGSAPEQWCPDCAACPAGCHGGHENNPCHHPNTSWAVTPRG